MQRFAHVTIPDNPVARLPEWTLRGISQVVFQNNIWTGLVILGAIFYNSGAYGFACLLGTITATLTALFLKADRALIKAGLFGYNGALLGIGLNAYMSPGFTTGAYPDWRLYIYIVLGAAFTAIVFSALVTAFGPAQVPALTAPFVLSAWLFIFAVLQFTRFHPGPLLAAALPGHVPAAAQHYTWTTWYQGAGKGIGEIFFQDNWITGYAMLFGIFLNTRIGAGMALLGTLLAAGTGIVLGAPEATIRAGLLGFNPTLTAIALGGVFFVLTFRSFAYAVFGILVTVWVSAAMTVVLSPIGMPTFTSAFVIVTLIMIFAKGLFPGLVPVAPADTTNPEDNLRRRQKARGAKEQLAPPAQE
ncbi:MAG: urea transporter [Streptosporangiaceae bacterium]